jgi:hypothetical protein
MCAPSLQDELTEEAFAKHVGEMAKSKLEKPRKLRTYLARWRLEILLARFDWKRVDTEVAALRQLSRRELVEFVDAALLDPAAGRQLAVGVAGAAERARDGGGSGNGAAAPAGSGGAAQSGAAVHGASAERGSEDASAGAGERANGAGAHVGQNGSAANGVHTVASAALAQGNSAGSSCGARGGKQGEVREVVLQPGDIPQFRLQQRLWPLTRMQWP